MSEDDTMFVYAGLEDKTAVYFALGIVVQTAVRVVVLMVRNTGESGVMDFILKPFAIVALLPSGFATVTFQGPPITEVKGNVQVIRVGLITLTVAA